MKKTPNALRSTFNAITILALCAVVLRAFAGTEPVNVNTANGHIKATSSGVGAIGKPFDGREVYFTRLPQKLTFYVNGQGSVLTTGTKEPIKIPYGGTLKKWTLIVKPSGSVSIDILRALNNAGLPVMSIIGGGTKPAVSSAVENSSASFSGWTSTTLNDGDNLAISLSGISSATYLALTLYFQ